MARLAIHLNSQQADLSIVIHTHRTTFSSSLELLVAEHSPSRRRQSKMPPKKRPAATSAATSAAKRKKVSIGGTSIMGEPAIAETYASGRPKRSSIGEPTYNGAATKTTSTKTAKSEVTKSPAKAATAARGRGRPRKKSTAQTEEERTPAKPTASSGKPVGRPKKSARSEFTRSPGQTARQPLKKATQSSKLAAPAAAKPRGRPKSTTPKTTPAAISAARVGKSNAKPKSTKTKAETAELQAETEEEVDGLTANESDWDAVDEGDGKQYWLMKAEPDSRLEKGVDVKFSIDDLMNAKAPEGWDGEAEFDDGVPVN